MLTNILLGITLVLVGLVVYMVWSDYNAAEIEYYKRMKRLEQMKKHR